MKTKSTFFSIFIFSLAAFSQDIMISGIGSGFNGSNGLVELYVINDIEYDQYYLQSVRSDNSTIGIYPLLTPLSAGQRIYLSSTDTGFEPFFGFLPDDSVVGATFFNGDDIIKLIDISFNIVDIYGEEGVDGTGTNWDYADGWAYRKSGFGPNTTFTISEWDVVTYAFDYCGSTNETCNNPYPIGSYTLSSDSKELSELRLFPNPANKGYVRIYGHDQSVISVQVFDVFGKQLSNINVMDNKLDVSYLNSGIYFLKISQSYSSITKKLVIN